MIRLVAASLALLAVTVAFPGQAQISGSASVTDGDTLRIGAQKIRLHGIDAPESKQTCRAGGKTWRCGGAATRAFRERIAGRTVACDERDRDKYGRIVPSPRIGAAGRLIQTNSLASGGGVHSRL